MTQGEWERLLELFPQEPDETPSDWLTRLRAIAERRVARASDEQERKGEA